MAPVAQMERSQLVDVRAAKDSIGEYLLDRFESLGVDSEGLVANTGSNIQITQTVANEIGGVIDQGFRRSLDAHLANLQRLQEDITEQARRLGLGTEFSKATQQKMTAIRRDSDLQTRGFAVRMQADLANLSELAAGNMKKADLLEQTRKIIKKYFDWTETLLLTNLMSFNSLIRISHGQDEGVEYYLYLGPNDSITRCWCKHFVGRLVTLDDLRESQDRWGRANQPKPVEAYRGGYNCRHQLVPVVSPRRIAKLKTEGKVGPDNGVTCG